MRLQPDGHIVVLGLDPIYTDPDWPLRVRNLNAMGGFANTLLELDWDGKVVFKYTNIWMHHDALKLPNGNYLFIAWEGVLPALRNKVRGGLKDSEFLILVEPGDRKAYFGGKLFKNRDLRLMYNDYLVEINPQGKPVWQWHANAHLDPNVDIIGPFYQREEWLHSNSLSILPNNDIVLTCRHTDAVYVINRKTGQISLRWGNTAFLDPTTGHIAYHMPLQMPMSNAVEKTLGGPHSGEVVPAGYPGAGDITIFDNGTYSFFSKVVELDPRSGKVVWLSRFPDQGRRLFSPFLGSAQRLPNGNTLVCEGINGRFIQLTHDSKIVWEYVNPDNSSPIFGGMVFKVRAYAPDYCPQFKGLLSAAGPAVIPPAKLRVDALVAPTESATAQIHRAITNTEQQAAQRLRIVAAVAALCTLIVALAAYMAGRRGALKPRESLGITSNNSS
jgi:hypothetical protein